MEREASHSTLKRPHNEGEESQDRKSRPAPPPSSSRPPSSHNAPPPATSSRAHPPSHTHDRQHPRGTHDSRTSQSGRTPPPPASASSSKPRIPWGSRSVEIFEKIEQIGEGTYGQVYKARNRETGEIVALKKIRMDSEKEGFPITAIREIKILKELNHKNIINLKEIVTGKSSKEAKERQSIYMVFEYMDHDMTGLMLSDGPEGWQPSQSVIKCYMKQLLEGLHYCHKNNVLHRDLKGSNLLIDNHGHLKLADFGLARPFNEQIANYTNRVITLWYRPPELLLGAVQYGPAIDMWSVGCILAELLAKKAILPGKNEMDQLELIFKLCGTPTEETWPDVVKLPWYGMLKPPKFFKPTIRETFRNFPKEALDLVVRMLTLDPNKRITASEALDSDYFWTSPHPAKPEDIPRYPSSHEFQAKKRRQQQQLDTSKRYKDSHGASVQPPARANAPPPIPPRPAGPPPPPPNNSSRPSIPPSTSSAPPSRPPASAPPPKSNP